MIEKNLYLLRIILLAKAKPLKNGLIRLLIAVFLIFSLLSFPLYFQKQSPTAFAQSSENSLTGEWKFDEGSGNTVADSSGNGNNGVIYSQPDWTAGKFGSALSFNGMNNYVELPKNLIKSSVVISISVWFKTTSNGVIIGCQGDEYPNTGQHHIPILYVGADGKLRGEFWMGASSHITTTFMVNDGNWHQAILTGDMNTQSLYLDGSLVGTLPGTIQTLDMSVNYVGLTIWSDWPASVGTWGFFTGSIDELQIYYQALTPAQAYTLYTSAPATLYPLSTPTPTVTSSPSASVSSSSSSLPSSSKSSPSSPQGTLSIPIITLLATVLAVLVAVPVTAIGIVEHRKRERCEQNKNMLLKKITEAKSDSELLNLKDEIAEELKLGKITNDGHDALDRVIGDKREKFKSVGI